MSENGEIYTAGKKFYTPAGTDGMDKFRLCDWTGYPLDCYDQAPAGSRIFNPGISGTGFCKIPGSRDFSGRD